MQQYEDIFSLQNHSTCHSTHHQEHYKLYSQPPVQVIISVRLLHSNVAKSVFSAPDDGCCDTRNMYSDLAVNKYLHTVASVWIFINIEARNFTKRSGGILISVLPDCLDFSILPLFGAVRIILSDDRLD